ncbi:PREDICTED: F-box/LRR-repeat protein 20-like [Priapulus caudatus]|uniref:F-box/LRR-repeat protein 20-like n=1 Tax=Priapulus caudatus TaxID=37621 RepID=A0ABM1DW27_PRICU|nr:PREDICTED: F-box/LRR-repeat protein 20-like [Priapulus caudatus]XP_014664149.1 PREDICTED: F-box/LRR-repeat protein 20-like [Priapulus caudatus]
MTSWPKDNAKVIDDSTPNLGALHDDETKMNIKKDVIKNKWELCDYTTDIADDEAVVEILPDSLVLKIFGYLDTANLCCGVRPTCRHWYELSYDRSLWRLLDVSESAVTDAELLMLLDTVKDQVQEINLGRCSALTDVGFVHAGITCTKLRKLHVNNTQISDEGLSALVHKYPHLRQISVYMCPCLSSIYAHLSKLNYLEEFVNPYLGMDDPPEDFITGLSGILGNCTRLRVLVIDECPSLTDDALEQIAQQCPLLAKLQLVGSMNVTDDGLVAFSKGCLSLLSLNVAMTTIGDHAIAEITTRCRSLQNLTISGAARITDRGLAAVGRHCASLRCLVVNDSFVTPSSVTDTGISAIARGCRQLRYLEICYCQHVGDTSVVLLARCCPLLEKLHVMGSEGVTDVTLQAVAETCPRFSCLVAQSCPGITDVGITALLTKCRQLEVVDVARCTNVKSFGEILVESPSRLSVLDVSMCEAIGGAALQQMAEWSPGLDHLFMHGCVEVDDDGVRALVQRCSILQHLELSVLPSQRSLVTDVGLGHIATHCKHLQQLNIRGNCYVTEAGLLLLLTKCVALRRLFLTVGAGTELEEDSIFQLVEAARGRCEALLTGTGAPDARNANFRFPPLAKTLYCQKNENVMDFGLY